ncbi:DotA/TraY family protein [Parachitinimonas caeni]|uniref:DotA/TraY family protein n=1 Tax=Parachitinimonas caeni TaxID=3031301 RepID=A0ABT7DYM7_9NEIS|nr:DotA/TraY family protein [Parachitinimonas caeni]MDK2125162.1 DotA/TraY family protein [Parachitinimonas caeni]
MFNPDKDDPSLQMLRDIFGTVIDRLLENAGNAGDGTVTVLGAMFGVFNSGLLLVGSMIITYVLIIGVANTANDGEAMGRSWSAVWTPLRMALGASMLLPTASGFSLIQIGLLQVVIWSVGLANDVYRTGLDTYAKTYQYDPVSLDLPTIGARDAVMAVFRSEICRWSINYGYNASVARLNNDITNPNDLLGNWASVRWADDRISQGIPTSLSGGTPICGKMIFSSPNKDKGKVTSGPSNPVSTLLEDTLGFYLPGSELDSQVFLFRQLIRAKQSYATQTMLDSVQSYSAYVFDAYLPVIMPGYVGQSAPSGPGGSGGSTEKCLSTTSSGGTSKPGNTTRVDVAELNCIAQRYERALSGDWQLAEVDLGPLQVQVKAPIIPELQKYWSKKLSASSSSGGSRSRMPEGYGWADDLAAKGWSRAGGWNLQLAAIQNAIQGEFRLKLAQTRPNFQRLPIDPSRQFVETSYETITNAIISQANNEYLQKPPQAKLELKLSSDKGKLGLDMKVIPAAADFLARDVIASGDVEFALKQYSSAMGESMTRWLIHSLVGEKNVLDRLKLVGDVVLQYSEAAMLAKLSLATQAGGATVNAMTQAGMPGTQAAGNQYQVLSSAAFPMLDRLTEWGLLVGYYFSIYLPMLPYAIFTIGVVGWLVAVIKAVAATPLWAMMHLTPSQGSFIGGQQQGYLMIFALFSRPSLMIFGLFTSIVLVDTVVGYINSVFIQIMAANTAGSWFGPLSILLYLLAYGMLLMPVLYMLFALPQTLPDHILRWIGAGIPDLGESAASSRMQSGAQGVVHRAQGVMSAMNSNRAGGGQRAAAGGAASGAGAGRPPKGRSESDSLPPQGDLEGVGGQGTIDQRANAQADMAPASGSPPTPSAAGGGGSAGIEGQYEGSHTPSAGASNPSSSDNRPARAGSDIEDGASTVTGQQRPRASHNELETGDSNPVHDQADHYPARTTGESSDRHIGQVGSDAPIEGQQGPASQKRDPNQRRGPDESGVRRSSRPNEAGIPLEVAGAPASGAPEDTMPPSPSRPPSPANPRDLEMQPTTPPSPSPASTLEERQPSEPPPSPARDQHQIEGQGGNRHHDRR